ncbi:hypothetical protein [Planctomycetes bacterium TBK1r]|uniref:hypothetical protein n=1 Tax=Stieleria magnilauensis TaxID=2527963 RepID=UPI0011A7197C
MHSFEDATCRPRAITIGEFSNKTQVDKGEHFTLQVIAVQFTRTADESQNWARRIRATGMSFA